MDWTKIDWGALERMRASFLQSSAGREDYWRSQTDLAAYDQTFAQRIGWKWDWVLADLARRGWSPPAGEVLDWGCGSGIAGRRFLGRFRERASDSLILHDRSAMAMDFAAGKAREELPGLSVARKAASGAGDVTAPTMLLSHVLGELNDRQVDSLLEQVRRATAVLWVEPGAYEVSRSLIAVRERLRGEFRIVAPCTHQAACGLLVPENQRHWCHHFAETPTEVFMDGNWARFARLAGIDLRSLPLSYLVLDKRPPAPLPADTARMIGRARIRKDAAILFGCDESGVHDRRLAKRAFPAEYRLCKRGDHETLQAWTLDGDEIVSRSEVVVAQ